MLACYWPIIESDNILQYIDYILGEISAQPATVALAVLHIIFFYMLFALKNLDWNILLNNYLCYYYLNNTFEPVEFISHLMFLQA